MGAQLVAQCWDCHGEQSPQAGLKLQSGRGGFLAGPFISPGWGSEMDGGISKWSRAHQCAGSHSRLGDSCISRWVGGCVAAACPGPGLVLTVVPRSTI